MRKILSYILIGITVSAITWFAYIKLTAAGEGDMAPDFSGVLADGSKFELADLRGDYVLLQFWGSWCGPCRRHNQELISFHRDYQGEIKIVSVAVEKEAEKGRQVANIDGFTWENQIVEESQFVLMSDIAQKYGVSSIPTTFLISPAGVLLGKKSLKEIETILNKE